MKIETKLKILHWVEKLLRWRATDDMYPIIIKEERQIQLVRADQLIPEKELLMISEDQLKFSIGLELLTELQKTPVIKYTMEKDDVPYSEDVHYKAELKYILP
jgi:hypothetical protein